jgi:hypothetical protein
METQNFTFMTLLNAFRKWIYVKYLTTRCSPQNCIWNFIVYHTQKTVMSFTKRLFLCMEIIGICFEGRRKHTNTLCFNYENNEQDVLRRLTYYSKTALHVSDDVFDHRQEHLTVFTLSGSVHPSCCRLVAQMGHQPATWVSTTRYCKYSQVLLMMGENIARNM